VDEARPADGGARVRQTLYAPPGALDGSPVARAVILVCVLVFAAEVFAVRSLWALYEVPLPVEIAFGANSQALSLDVGHAERLLASCFVHGSLLHLLLNMYTLRQVSGLVEPEVGSARFAVLFVVTGIAGSLASAFVMGKVLGRPPMASVGASGAICGVMGAAVVVGARIEGWKSESAWQVGFWLLVMLAIGMKFPRVDNAAHIGGLVAGIAMAALWRRTVVYSRARTAFVVGASGALCVAAGAIIAWRDRTDPYAGLDVNERLLTVQLALDQSDCAGARQAMRAAERVGGDRPELAGLRTVIESRCPPEPLGR